MFSLQKHFFTFLLMACLSVNVWANTNTTPNDAKQLIETTTDQLITALQEQREALMQDPSEVYVLINDLVIQHFDLRMSRFVLGREIWTETSEQQQTDFTNAFRSLLVRTYATALARSVLEEGVDVSVNYLPIREADDARIILVKTEVLYKGEQFSVSYRLYRTREDEWKVFDVLVEGVSLVINYQNEFKQDYRNIGIEGLIAKISKRNQEENTKAMGEQSE